MKGERNSHNQWSWTEIRRVCDSDETALEVLSEMDGVGRSAELGQLTAIRPGHRHGHADWFGPEDRYDEIQTIAVPAEPITLWYFRPQRAPGTRHWFSDVGDRNLGVPWMLLGPDSNKH